MLIVGGIVLLYVDQLKIVPKYTSIYDYPPLLCLYIGLFQVLSLVPGVSRSGSTIVGCAAAGHRQALGGGVQLLCRDPADDRRLRARFLEKPRLIVDQAGLDIAIGFAFAFVSAFFVVRYALGFIQRNGFAFFAYWRIFVGAIGLWGVLLFK